LTVILYVTDLELTYIVDCKDWENFWKFVN